MKRRPLLGGLAAVCLLHALPASAALPPAERERIEQLLAAMEQEKGVEFERNGRRASARDAVRFLRAKWERYGEGVDSAEAFIDRIASRSSTTGRPYRVCPTGSACVDAGPWLKGRLVRLAGIEPTTLGFGGQYSIH